MYSWCFIFSQLDLPDLLMYDDILVVLSRFLARVIGAFCGLISKALYLVY